MTISTADRKLIKSIIAQLEGLAAGDVAEMDFEGLSAQINAMPSNNHELAQILEEASFHLGDLEDADEDNRADYVDAALSSVCALADYRAPGKPKAKQISTPRTAGEIQFVMIDDVNGYIRF